MAVVDPLFHLNSCDKSFMIPFVDLKIQYDAIQTEIDNAIRTTIESSAFISGPAVHEFEEKFADLYGVRHAISMGSGTDALHMAVRACDIGPGDDPFRYLAQTNQFLLYRQTGY